MRYIVILCLVILASLLGACQVLNAPNVPATLSAQNTAYAAEASAMPVTLGETAIAVARTAVMAETTVADINSINRQLIATLNAVVPATPALQVGSAPSANNGQPANASGNTLVDLGVAARKRDSDGCADGTQSQFPADVPIIYATSRATSIGAGAKVAVEWKYQGQVVGSGSYTVPNDQTNFCIWFPLDPANVPFTPGSWSVQFTLNGNVVEPTIFFNIGDVQTPSQ
ncbi:MAG: hypothetical protein GC179_09905 [Anaerolineaceae bacterium]|nr:hypothetical protein [Anaerolineaceae bacterium]